MQSGNPFGFRDHQPFSGLSDELVYGISADGSSIHISQAARGLRCDCRCPACEQVLVAKKGEKQIHHFAHYNIGTACAHVAETNAHIWAKDVLERVKCLTIPAVTAEHGGVSKVVSPSQTYRFAHARLEKKLGSIVPDVVLITQNGTELIVEVRVTHPCDDIKLEKLRKEGLSAIEIDLRHYRTSANRGEVEQALLSKAPREWLSNAKKAKFDEQLRLRLANEQEQRAREAEARAKRAADLEAQKVRREEEQAERDARRLIHSVRTLKGFIHELPDAASAIIAEFGDVPWSDMHSIGFTVNDLVWEAELTAKYLTHPNAFDYQDYEPITIKQALRSIEHYVIPGFLAEIRPNVRDRLGTVFPHKRIPAEALEAFFDQLVGSGYLVPNLPGSYHVDDGYAARLSEKVRRQAAYEHRLETVRARVTVVIAGLSRNDAADFEIERWLSNECHSLKASPDTLCRVGDARFREFDRLLRHIELMCEGGPAAEELLGLPLKGEVTRALDRERHRLLRAAANRRQSLTEAAISQLGEEAHAWLSGPSADDEELTRIDQAGVDDLSYQRARRELERATALRQAAARARKEALACQEELREAGAKLMDKEHLDLFLRAFHPALGKSPLTHCVDKRSLKKCLALLSPTRHSGRRR